MERCLNPKQLIIVDCARKKMACLTKRSSGRNVIGSAIAVNTKTSATKALSAINVVWKSRGPLSAVSGWATSPWLLQWRMSGIRAACPLTLVSCWISHAATLTASCILRSTWLLMWIMRRVKRLCCVWMMRSQKRKKARRKRSKCKLRRSKRSAMRNSQS